MIHAKTLQRTVVLFVFFVMALSSILTAFFYMSLSTLRLIPDWIFMTLWAPTLALAVSLIIGTAITFVVARLILRPLEDLIRATHKVADGDFSVHIDEKDSVAEFNELIRSFNYMTEELGRHEIFCKDFINTFSHEFKTPIVSIRGFAKRLRDDVLPPETRREYIDIIISETERLSKLSTNILLLSKYENQEILTDKTEFSLDEQIRRLIVLLERQWKQKKIGWNIELKAANYYGNAEMTSQIWLNLLSNAIKFSPEGSIISVSLTHVPGGISVSIGDEGPGMSEEIAPHVFEKFYQGDASHKKEGNGLGLSIVKRVVELCGGSIRLKTAPGEGSVFTVTLPVKSDTTMSSLKEAGK